MVSSATLAPETPVVLEFELALSAASFATSPGVDNNASVGIEVGVRDTASLLFTLATEVGRTLSLTGQMEIGASAKVFGLPGENGGDVLRTSSVEASQTGHLYYRPSGDIALVGGTGHNYAFAVVPAPSGAWLLLTGVAALLGRRCRG